MTDQIQTLIAQVEAIEKLCEDLAAQLVAAQKREELLVPVMANAGRLLTQLTDQLQVQGKAHIALAARVKTLEERARRES